MAYTDWRATSGAHHNDIRRICNNHNLKFKNPIPLTDVRSAREMAKTSGIDETLARQQIGLFGERRKKMLKTLTALENRATTQLNGGKAANSV
jgi:hypothetical protein